MENSVYTDLASEAHAALLAQAGGTIPGVESHEERRENAVITRVQITTPQAAAQMGKAVGRYITIDCPGLRRRDRDLQEEMSETLAAELNALIGLAPDDEVLVVGLGNWNATPDALGPRVIDGILVSRHLRDFVPEDMKGNLRGVAAIAPGVLGLTGIETGEIVRGVVDRVKPAAIICVDALAARSLDRIATAIQIADSGISPGSGVGNTRTGLSRESLGIPVYALGVPTVVHAVTIAYDTLDLLAQQLRNQHLAYGFLAEMDPNLKRSLVRQVLNPSVGDLVVTPKEIDVLITDISRVVAGGINRALHPALSKEEISLYVD